ncbi:MAG TPA: hydrolase [Bacillota bacterium]|nr:hydrolase [Bacillota bacterium]HQC35518.1 hydrolase [Bacillota bacterium]
MEIKDKTQKFVPTISSKLKGRIIQVPEATYRASGISIMGRRIKSLLFSTDVAIITNTNAQGIIAVYPFTPQLSIIKPILEVSPVPVFAGVGGGVTSGIRSLNIAIQAELLGAYGVVVNTPTTPENIALLAENLDIPVIATIVSPENNYREKVEAGARILNVSGGKNTAELVRKIRLDLGPEFPIIATGGNTDENVTATIAAGANCISYTPPSTAEIFEEIMKKYREGLK